MNTFSRRQFLKSLGAVAALFLANRTGFTFAQNSESFEMLVVGDSLVWGQGLEEKDKFFTLTKNWLTSELNKQVNIKVKAHSGATIFLHDNEAKLLQKGGKSENDAYYPEVNISFPTIKAQIDLAKIEYESPEKLNLVLLSGGIVDVTVPGVLNPFGNDKTLRVEIKKYCNEEMFRFLEHSANVFPNALFVVVGYFPIISKQSATGKIFNALLEAYSIPRPLKPLANNILIRQFFKPIKNKALNRSRIWFEDSNREFQIAVDRLNDKFGKQRAVFVKSPLTEANSFETAETLLFKMENKGRINDNFYDKRRAECNKVFGEMRKSIGLKQSIRQCEIAAIAHPNPGGAKSYFQAIKTNLQPLLQVNSQKVL